MTDMDLFGNSVDVGIARSVRDRPKVNDMALIERVLKVACAEGYALVGRAGQVYRVDGKDAEGVLCVASVPESERIAVRQLIEARLLVVGGRHSYRHRNRRESCGRSVLASKNARGASVRWSVLVKPGSWESGEGKDI